MLDGVHPAGRERAAVAHPLDAEGDRLGVVARSHEVRVDGVQPAVGAALDRPHGATARDDSLGEHLPAEDPPVRLLLALAAEQGDVLGEGLRQRDRLLAVRAGSGRHRLHAHLRRPQLLQVERREEVEQGRRLVGGHRGNDSQRAASPRPRSSAPRRGTWVKTVGHPKLFTHVREGASGQATRGRPPGCREVLRRPCRVPEDPPARTVSTARASRSTASVITSGGEHVRQAHPALQATDHREARTRGDEQPLVLGRHRDPARVDALGQLAPQEEPAARHPEAQLGQAGAQRRDQRVARGAQVVAPLAGSAPGRSASARAAPAARAPAPRGRWSPVTRRARRARCGGPAPSRCAGRPSATSTSCRR